MTRTWIAALACLIWLPSAAVGQEPRDPEQQIRQLEETRRQAVLHNDVDTLARLYAKQMTTIDIRGEFHTNNDLAAPRLNEPATRTTMTWAPDEMKIRLFGDTAVVTQRARIVDEIRVDARSYTARLTHVWVRRNGRWQLVARQATRVASN